MLLFNALEYVVPELRIREPTATEVRDHLVHQEVAHGGFGAGDAEGVRTLRQPRGKRCLALGRCGTGARHLVHRGDAIWRSDTPVVTRKLGEHRVIGVGLDSGTYRRPCLAVLLLQDVRRLMPEDLQRVDSTAHVDIDLVAAVRHAVGAIGIHEYDLRAGQTAERGERGAHGDADLVGALHVRHRAHPRSRTEVGQNCLVVRTQRFGGGLGVLQPLAILRSLWLCARLGLPARLCESGIDAIDRLLYRILRRCLRHAHRSFVDGMRLDACRFQRFGESSRLLRALCGYDRYAVGVVSHSHCGNRLLLLSKLSLGYWHGLLRDSIALALHDLSSGHPPGRLCHQFAWRTRGTGVQYGPLVARHQGAGALLLLSSLIGFNIAQHPGLRDHQRLRRRLGGVGYQQVVSTHTGRIRAAARRVGGDRRLPDDRHAGHEAGRPGISRCSHGVEALSVLLCCERSLLLRRADTGRTCDERRPSADRTEQCGWTHVAGGIGVDLRIQRRCALAKRHVLRRADGCVCVGCALDGTDTAAHQAAAKSTHGSSVDAFLRSLGGVQRLTGAVLLEACLDPLLPTFDRDTNCSGRACAREPAADASHLLHTLAADLDAAGERAEAEHVGQNFCSRSSASGTPCPGQVVTGDLAVVLVCLFGQAAVDVACFHSEVLREESYAGADRAGQILRSCLRSGFDAERDPLLGGAAHHGVRRLGDSAGHRSLGGRLQDGLAYDRSEAAGGNSLQALPDDVPCRVLQPIGERRQVALLQVIPRVGEFNRRRVLLVLRLLGDELVREVILGGCRYPTLTEELLAGQADQGAGAVG